jgi:vacuolar protein-sorting-associated protein 4
MCHLIPGKMSLFGEGGEKKVRIIFMIRFYPVIALPLPNKQNRILLLKKFLSEVSNELNDNDFELMAEQTEHFSPADLGVLARDAAMHPLREILIVSKWKKV